MQEATASDDGRAAEGWVKATAHVAQEGLRGAHPRLPRQLAGISLTLLVFYLQHAEKLYQKGFLSYPRTETDQYDKDFDFATLIGKQTQDPNWGPFAQRCVPPSVLVAALQTDPCPVAHLPAIDFKTAGLTPPATARRTTKLILPSIRRPGRARQRATRSACTSLSFDGSWRVARRMRRDGRRRL